jgi:uncharacterized protein (DUF58 family)
MDWVKRIAEWIRRFRAGWRQFWSWRRITFSRGGAFFTAGTLAVGFAAITAGNNLLYLLLGAMLGFIAISSWLSEQVIGEIQVHRQTPRGVTAGHPARIEYGVLNRRERIPAFALEIGEEDLSGQAFIPFLKAGEQVEARSENRFTRRGVFFLASLTVSTSFPFGLFRKTRTLNVPGELVIWPRTDRRIRASSPGGGRDPLSGTSILGAAGPRGEYRGLRGYRPGDDPKDIHWRTTARLGIPVVREYEQNVAETLWICLDTRGEPGDRAEAAVETAAALGAKAFREGKRFGFASPGVTIDPGHGPGQLEAILDALARVEFDPHAPTPLPPVSPRRCVLVTLTGTSGSSFGTVVVPTREREGTSTHSGGSPLPVDPSPADLLGTPDSSAEAIP